LRIRVDRPGKGREKGEEEKRWRRTGTGLTVYVVEKRTRRVSTAGEEEDEGRKKNTHKPKSPH
jgi:hypothetical protein